MAATNALFAERDKLKNNVKCVVCSFYFPFIFFSYQFGIARYVLLILVCSFRFLGYRHIHLLGNKGESLGYASLFVHINIWGGSKPNKSSDRSSLSVRLQFVADIAVYQDVVILLR